MQQERKMAPSPLRTITRKHARSISLPSRSTSFMPQFDEHLSRVKASEAASTSTLSSMSTRLSDLKNLYECTDDLLQLPHIQRVISQSCQDKWADELLDGYLWLLDACTTTREIFSQVKQSVQELLSALRRKDRDELSGYLTSRRHSKKIIQKALKNFRKINNKQSVITPEKDNETVAVYNMMKEIESITLNLFDSFLSRISGSTRSGWSLMSKLMKKDKESGENEFEKVDSFINQKLSNKNDVEELQNQLGDILTSIQTVEEELERSFRCLIKSRVSLLNILSY